MYLTAMTQRDRLFEVATRWFRGSAHPHDGRFITEAFLLDHGITMPVVTTFLKEISQVLHSGQVEVVRVARKEEVRERIISGWSRPSSRAKLLFDAYQSQTEDFFPNTPVDLFVATGQDGTLVAMTRLKRITRIADKLARKVAGRTTEEIRRVALKHQVGAAPFAAGKEGADGIERLAALDFKNGRLAFSKDDLRIDDIIGTKFVGEQERLREIERCILQHPRVLSVDRKEHRGAYNDVNLVVKLACPPPSSTIDSLRQRNWSVAAERGLDPKIVLQDIPEYIETGADSFTVEIILCTWDDLVESEFGEGLHEERVLHQRTDLPHSGQIATNASIAMIQLLLAAISPTVVVDDLPVKIWGRYLTDSLALSMSRLFGIDIGGSPFWVPKTAAVTRS